jgi:hypothetical protein
MIPTLKPGVPQPGAFPDVMSFRPATPFEYKRGFRNPRGERPEERRASFRSDTIAEKVGVAAEVPEIRAGMPWKKMRKFKACAETSGIPCGKVTLAQKGRY